MSLSFDQKVVFSDLDQVCSDRLGVAWWDSRRAFLVEVVELVVGEDELALEEVVVLFGHMLVLLELLITDGPVFLASRLRSHLAWLLRPEEDVFLFFRVELSELADQVV